MKYVFEEDINAVIPDALFRQRYPKMAEPQSVVKQSKKALVGNF